MVVMARRNFLPDLLEERSMSIYRLAQETRMPHHNVSRIVTSPTIPDGVNYKTLRKIAAALGVKIDDMEVEE